jgi:hypothetical protein
MLAGVSAPVRITAARAKDRARQKVSRGLGILGWA